MLLSSSMPLWLTRYPEFSVGVAKRCVQEVESMQQLALSFRNRVSDIGLNVLKDGHGPWVAHYKKQAEHSFYWLGEVSRVMSVLAGNMEKVLWQAQREEDSKEMAWRQAQRFISPFQENMIPVSADVALRECVCFRTRNFPLSVPQLASPLSVGLLIDSVVGPIIETYSFSQEVGADTGVLREGAQLWMGMRGSFSSRVDEFERAVQAWGRECGSFAPADFSSLIEALRDWEYVAGRQAGDLDELAQRFDNTQESILNILTLPFLTSYRVNGTQNFPMLTDEEYHYLSQLAYNIDDGLVTLGPTKTGKFRGKFTVLKIADRGNGMQALAVAPLVDGQPNYEHIVIAYAGTEQLSDWGEDFAEIIAGMDIAGGQLETAKEFYDDVQLQYPDAKLSTTGHSLGGFLGITVAAENRSPSTSFCAPNPSTSLSPETRKYVKANPDLYTNYRVAQDPIGNFGGDDLGIATYTGAQSNWVHGVDKNFKFGDDGELLVLDSDILTGRAWSSVEFVTNRAANAHADKYAERIQEQIDSGYYPND